MALIETFVNAYKKKRKYKFLSQQIKKQYAFAGIGNHSINNLYPVLDYLHVPLKYIVTQSAETSRVINKSNKFAPATCDYNIALNDPEIEGIFISASPKSHYSLVVKAIEHNKKVFVEKPPCYTIDELQTLIELQKQYKKEVLVGFQKRYAPAYTILKQKISDVSHYSIKYCTGAYPEGNVLMDLFIHPIDIACHLFGECEIKSVINIGSGTKLIHLIHNNGIAGTLELSTAYSWQTSVEQLTVVSKKGIYKLNSTADLQYESKPQTVNKIPLEKILKFVPETKILFNHNNFIPTMYHNNIYVNGYYSEIENFVNLCEGTGGKNKSDLISLLSIYKILDTLAKA